MPVQQSLCVSYFLLNAYFQKLYNELKYQKVEMHSANVQLLFIQVLEGDIIYAGGYNVCKNCV